MKTTREMRPMSAQDQARFLSMTVLMTPDMANFFRRCSGGAVLKLLEPSGLRLRQPYAGQYVVTLSVDR